jgi:type III secretion system YscD/HrpQ family protein
MTAKLVAEEGLLKGLVLSLEEGDQWVIGRDPDACQLLVEDPSVSRQHVLCRATSDGIVIENLSVTNPVLVNDVEVKEPRLLQQGDLVKIGNELFRFYAEPVAQLLKETTDEEELSAEGIPEEVLSEDAFSKIERDEKKQALPEEAPETSPKTEDELFEELMETRQDTIFDEEAPEGKDILAEINFGLIDSGRWLLKVIGGPNNGAEFSMQAGTTYMIGTDPNACDIVFHDTSVSRQHARITVSQEDTLTIEDLKSRNGTLVDDEPLKTKRSLAPNVLVSMGTTSFIVFDREGEMQTIISPLMPSIVKVLQKEEPKKAPEPEPTPESTPVPVVPPPVAAAPAPEPKKLSPETASITFGAFILIGIITGLFIIVGIGTSTLFKSEPIAVTEVVDPGKILDEALSPFPSVRHSFNKTTGRLLLVGHVLTGIDKNQLLYNLQGLKFIKSIDDSGIIIDEYVWRETNNVLENNPNWKGINVYSPTPGHFILSGYLQTRSQADRLYEYISANFPYLDMLEKRVVVEEDVIATVKNDIYALGFKDIQVKLSGGEVVLMGGIPAGRAAEFDALVAEIKEISGVRSVRNFVTEMSPEQAIKNISNNYEVTGFSSQGEHISVVINGRILTKGDTLDGMKITDIQSNVIYLEQDGTKYRIDFSK